MINDLMIPARNIYVQATEPIDKTEGKFWFNTINKLTYVSDGANYGVITTDLNPIYIQQLQQDMNILINSVESSSTLQDYDEMFIDICSDSSGMDNTINTGSTDAYFSTNKYMNSINTIEEVAHGNATNGTWSSVTVKSGMKIHTNQAFIVNKIKKYSDCTATKVYIQTALGSGVVASATFVGDEATFSSPVSLNNSTSYYILFDNDGSSYTASRCYPTSSGLTNAYCDYSARIENDGNEYTPVDRTVNIVSFNVGTQDFSNKVVQINKVDLNSAPSFYFVYAKNVVAGSGSVTYDISFDNGVTWEEDNLLNKINYTSTTDTEMILKLKLNGVGVGNTSEIYNYGVLIG